MTTKPEELARVFKVGDRVRVVKTGVGMAFHEGQEFTVQWVDGAFINVGAVAGYDPEITWRANRFELLPADPAREEREPLQVIPWKDCEPAAKAPDPYEGWDVDGDESVRNVTDQLPRNLAARARLVAALAAELDRPAPVRFPAEGRSERALPRSNGRG